MQFLSLDRRSVLSTLSSKRNMLNSDSGSMRAKSTCEHGENRGCQSTKRFWVSQNDFQNNPQNGPKMGPVFYFERPYIVSGFSPCPCYYLIPSPRFAHSQFILLLTLIASYIRLRLAFVFVLLLTLIASCIWLRPNSIAFTQRARARSGLPSHNVTGVVTGFPVNTAMPQQ